MADQRRNPDQRPSPEALLEAARREEGRVGRLRIFVGAAPGVGKTYAMLNEGRRRHSRGTDVVVFIHASGFAVCRSSAKTLPHVWLRYARAVPRV